MIDDLKLVWRVITYSAYKKTGLTICGIALALIVYNLCNGGMPGIFAMIIVSWIPQSLLSVDLTHMMAASSKRKRLYEGILPAINAVANILGFTLSVLVYCMGDNIPKPAMATGIILTGIFALESQIFMACIFKKNYWACMVIFFVVAYATILFGMMGGATRLLDSWSVLRVIKGEHGKILSILIGYACILLGALLYKVITCRNYPYETQARSFRGMGGKDPRV